MEKHLHSDLLKLQSQDLPARTPFCPEDQIVAEYFDGYLADANRNAFEQHLSDCSYCLARIGMLHRQQEAGGKECVPEDILASAKQLRPVTRRRSLYRAPSWAAAAIVVIAVFFIVRGNPVPDQEFGLSPQVVLPPHHTESQLRNIDGSKSSLDILIPAPGTAITQGSMIRWNGIPGDTHYNVFILSPAGEVLWKEHLQSPEWILPDKLELPEGDEVFFRVEAELPAGGTISSKHLLLQTAKK